MEQGKGYLGMIMVPEMSETWITNTLFLFNIFFNVFFVESIYS